MRFAVGRRPTTAILALLHQAIQSCSAGDRWARKQTVRLCNKAWNGLGAPMILVRIAAFAVFSLFTLGGLATATLFDLQEGIMAATSMIALGASLGVLIYVGLANVVEQRRQKGASFDTSNPYDLTFS
jgi:hypothetical protein